MVLDMKIDSNLSHPWLEPIGRAAEEATPPDKPAEAKQAQAAFPEDRFTPSSTAADPSRAEKVQRLQAAINDGRYNVSAEDLADAILRDWKA